MSQSVQPHYMKETQSSLNRASAIQRDRKNKSISPFIQKVHFQEQKKRSIKKQQSPQHQRCFNNQSYKQQQLKQERQNYHKQKQQNHRKVTPKNDFYKDTKINQNNQYGNYKAQNQKAQDLKMDQFNQKQKHQKLNQLNTTKKKQLNKSNIQVKSQLPRQKQQTQQDKQNKSQINDIKSQTAKSPNYLLIQKKKQNQDQFLQTPVKQKQIIQNDSYAKQQTNKQPTNINIKKNENTTKKEQKQVSSYKQIKEKESINYKKELNDIPNIEQPNQQYSNAEQQNKQQKRVEQLNQQSMKVEQSNKQPIYAEYPKKIEQQNKQQIKVEQLNQQPINVEQLNQQPKKIEQSNKLQKQILEQNIQQMKVEQPNQQPIQIEQSKKQPIIDQSNKEQMKVEQPHQQPIRIEQSNQQPIIDQSNKQQMEVEQPNQQPLKIEQSFQQPVYEEQQNKKSLNIDQTNKQALNTKEQNKLPQKIEQFNNSFQAIQIAFDYKRLEKTVELSKQLTQISSKIRTVSQNYCYYLQQYEDIQGLFSHYSIKQLAVKNNLKKYCKKILHVRGDGNCFYTAFGFQFLCLILSSYNDTQFKEFLNFAITIKFKIYYKHFQIADDKIEQLLIEEFLYNLQEIRKIEDQSDRISVLYKKYREFVISDDGNGCFYLLSTLFFRNLSNQLLEYSEMKAIVEDRENLLIWEAECNNNEIIIATLAKHLKINIKLLFFKAGQFELREYEEHEKDQIILLIQPGHYNIGLNN